MRFRMLVNAAGVCGRGTLVCRPRLNALRTTETWQPDRPFVSEIILAVPANDKGQI